MRKHFLRRWGRWGLLLAVLSFPAVLWGAVQALLSNANNVGDWLPVSFHEAEQYGWFYRNFGGDEILAVSWPGCTVDDERLDRLAAALESPPRAHFFKEVTTGRSVLEELTAAPLRLSTDEALGRMSGWLVGPDGRTTCMVLRVSDNPDRHGAVAAVRSAAKEACDLSEDDLRIGGPTMDSVAIDVESTRSLYWLLGLSLIVGVLLSWWALASIRLTIIVFVTALLCEFWSLSLVYVSGYNMDSVLIMMPALVYILAVSGSVHQVNYYLEELRTHGPRSAPQRALAKCWKPSLMANATTGLGLLSLMVSDVVPVKKFGIFSAIGVAISLGFLFLFLPAALEFWPPKRRPRGTPNKPEEADHPATRWKMAVAMASIKHYRPILVVSALLIPVLGYGVLKIQTSVKLRDLFGGNARVINDYRFLEENIGPLVPVEIVLRFKPGAGLSMLEQMEIVSEVQDKVASLDEVGGTMSAITFAQPIPPPAALRQAVQRKVTNSRFEHYREDLRRTGFLADSLDGESLWRISARVAALGTVDYGEFLSVLRGAVDPLVSARSPAKGPPIESVISGGVSLITLVQRELFNDLIASFSTAVLMIGLVMLFALRSLPAMIVTMIPNVFPLVVIFGLMGWTGIVVDLGSMMTISTALGISVDNELHFFAWYRQALNRGLPQREALIATYHHCGGAMAQTGIICGLGMLVFAISPFVPAARFGWLMFLLIATAMAGDMVLLPALLSSQFGQMFGKPKKMVVIERAATPIKVQSE